MVLNSSLPPTPPGKNSWSWLNPPESLAETMPDGKPWPKISVVTPSFNQGQYIEDTIRSVLLQGYPNLEFIIIDGGSTDNSVEIIKKYEPWLTYWVSEPDRGQGHAINKGITKATGEFLFWLNSDDIVLPEAFKIAVTTFKNNPGSKLVTGQAQIINSQSEVIGELKSYFSSWEELVTNPRNSVRQISTFFSRNLFQNYGLLNEDLFISMDNELIVRFTQHTAPIILEEYLCALRSHPAAKTATQLITGYKETDVIRFRYLNTKELRALYKQRSMSNWLSLYESTRIRHIDRIACLLRAIKIQPSVFCKRRFWSATKQLLLGR